ncbi:MAG: TetR/AcrR family transcriptional regulator [Saccharofermentans sp.]|nr:TetR/AcrR family transcriptional regulator [Saccharofermentans sp.]
MPRDKSLSHIRVNKAIREEFLEKGFEGASVRSIGARAGMTSAGLYRHYRDKEAMFDSVVEPLIDEIKVWNKNHIAKKYALTGDKTDKEVLFGETFIDLIKNIIIPHREEFLILMNCSAGTRYENFIHNYVEENQHEFMRAIDYMEQKGLPVKKIRDDELHILLSAYFTACLEPVIHTYDDRLIEKYLNTVQEFFMPGWLKIMGLQ